jgi:hypothetical protein
LGEFALAPRLNARALKQSFSQTRKAGEQDALRRKLQKKSWGLPKRALRGLLFAGGKREAFKPYRGPMRFLADRNDR